MLLLRTVLPLLFLLAAKSAAAADAEPTPASALKWRCWYDRHTHIACVIETPPQAPTGETVSEYLPPIVRELRRNPEAFSKRLIRIPLHAQPDGSMERTALLAKAAMCGSRTDCSVDFRARPPLVDEIDALLEQNPTAAGPLRTSEKISPEIAPASQ